MRRLVRELGLLAGLALLPALVTGAVQLQWHRAPPLHEGEVNVAQAKAWGALWVDARTRAKFERRHVPDALLLNVEEWDGLVAKFLDAWEPDKPIVVYGDGSGDNAINTAQRLKEDLKLDRVWLLQGGWDAWTQQ
jgi:rhodanese-related sulfurtransferase